MKELKWSSQLVPLWCIKILKNRKLLICLKKIDELDSEIPVVRGGLSEDLAKDIFNNISERLLLPKSHMEYLAGKFKLQNL